MSCYILDRLPASPKHDILFEWSLNGWYMMVYGLVHSVRFGFVILLLLRLLVVGIRCPLKSDENESPTASAGPSIPPCWLDAPCRRIAAQPPPPVIIETQWGFHDDNTAILSPNSWRAKKSKMCTLVFLIFVSFPPEGAKSSPLNPTWMHRASIHGVEGVGLSVSRCDV